MENPQRQRIVHKHKATQALNAQKIIGLGLGLVASTAARLVVQVVEQRLVDDGGQRGADAYRFRFRFSGIY